MSNTIEEGRSDLPLWRWTELAQALESPQPAGARASGTGATGVSIDSRTLVEGDLFVALSGDPGPRFHTSGEGARDGHDFIHKALERGASALLVHRAVSASVPTFRVEDTLDGLWALGRFARRRTRARVVAVTGSSGKTTARTYIEALLGSAGRVHASLGSLNNHWGVPLSLARMPRDCDYGIFEVGTSHPGEIAPLARLVEPEVALLLNVAPAHMGYFTDLDAIRREKLSIMEGLAASGTLVVPADLDLTGYTPSNLIRFGDHPSAEVRCRAIEPGDSGWRVRVALGGTELQFTLAEGGRHRVATALAALAVLYALGIDAARAVASLEQLRSPGGRGNRHNVKGIVVVDDSYNANPASMAHALELLGHSHAARRIAILGDMLELGEASERLHRELVASCEGVDRLVLVGPAMRHLYDALPVSQRWIHCERVDDLDIEAVLSELRRGDELLIKGSNRIFWNRGFVPRLLEHLGGNA